MNTQNLTLFQLLDLIDLEDYRGIINKKGFLSHVKRGIMPKVINDVRGSIRLTVERDGEKFEVIQYTTAHAMATVGEIY